MCSLFFCASTMPDFLEWLGLKKGTPPKAGGRLPVSLSGGAGSSSASWSWGGLFGGGNRAQPTNFRYEVGDPLSNSAVMACVNWIVTNWPQAAPTLYVPSQENSGSGTEKAAFEPTPHRMTDLMRRPSPFYDGRLLLQAVMLDFYGAEWRGNAYIYIVVVNGEPVELQHLPTDTIKPVGDTQSLITGYEYRPSGDLVATIPPENIIHFRNGFDTRNPRIGRDPLLAVYPEIATDNRATTYQYGILKRGGVPPWIMAPKAEDGQVAVLSAEDAEYMKRGVEEAVNGKVPGGGLVIPAGFQFEKLGFDPKSMVMGETQRKAEERIAAQIGIPPVVAGLGAGLDRSTFNNYAEARQAGWEDCIIPMQQAFAGEISSKLLPFYNDIPDGSYFGYDTSGIRCLMDDETAKATDAALLFEKGVIDRASAKKRIGETPEDGDKDLYTGAGAVSAIPPVDPNAPNAPNQPIQPNQPTPKAGENGPPFAKKDLGTGSQATNLSTLEQAVKQFRDALRQKEDRAVLQMRGAAMIAEKRIQGDLDALLLRVEQAAANGETVDAAWLDQEASLRALLLAIEATYTSLGSDAAPKLADQQRAAVTDAARASETLATAAVGPAPGSLSLQWNALPTGAIEALVGFASDGSPLSDLIAAIGPDTAQAIRAALIQGTAAGDNPRQVARAMRQGAQAQIDLSRARAETIARTEMLRAAREASRQSYEANSDVVTGYTRVCAGDSRVCAACFALHGTKYEGSAILPSHPSCRCCMVAITKSWAEITGDESIPDTRPVIETADALFARLSDTDKETVLGRGGYAAWNNGNGTPLSAFGVVLQDARWGPTVRVATLSELGV